MWTARPESNRDVSIAIEDVEASEHVWHIPRPSLWSNTHKWSVHTPGRGSTSSQGSSTSNASTQSGSSGSLLLTAANLAALRAEQSSLSLPKPADTLSVASSTHFTVVNGMGRRSSKPLPSCCWHSHQLTALVVAMSLIFLVALLLAVFYLEMRWRDIRFFE